MLIWVDVETTGLDPYAGSLLEVACVVTDNRLREVDSASFVLQYRGEKPAPTEQMHTVNGLWDACKISELSVHEVGEGLRSLAEVYCQAKTEPMCGSSIHFDRAWLAVHMPEFEKFFNHRHVDVSSFNEWAKRYAPEVYKARPKNDNPEHRALPDIRYSIELLRYYREAL